ncbi:MAG TPA: hypothetical protein ENI68_01645, partial [Gammaproteobacteria bacterium]|nr:hypothetical protein [Gammaproteobacteria bacterium]
MNYFTPIVIFLVLVLTACGGSSGGGSTSGSLPTSRPAGTVSGVAFDGVVSGGTVSIYDFGSGSKGASLGSGQTGNDGQFSIEIITPDKPILIEVEGGAYLEEASGLQVQIDPSKDQKLSAVQLYQSGQPLIVNTTFFTTLATGLAEYSVQAEGRSAADAIQAANQEISGWAGFDVIKTLPIDVTDPVNRTAVLTDQLRAGLVAAGISELTRQVSVDAGQPEHSTWNSIAFIQTAYDDIRADGVLNGLDATGMISLGSTVINADTYRATLAERILQFAEDSRNSTGLGFNEAL